MLRQCERLLAAGGHLLASFPNRRSVYWRLQRGLKRTPLFAASASRHQRHQYDPGTVRKMAMTAGLELRGITFFALPLQRYTAGLLPGPAAAGDTVSRRPSAGRVIARDNDQMALLISAHPPGAGTGSAVRGMITLRTLRQCYRHVDVVAFATPDERPFAAPGVQFIDRPPLRATRPQYLRTVLTSGSLYFTERQADLVRQRGGAHRRRRSQGRLRRRLGAVFRSWRARH